MTCLFLRSGSLGLSAVQRPPSVPPPPHPRLAPFSSTELGFRSEFSSGKSEFGRVNASRFPSDTLRSGLVTCVAGRYVLVLRDETVVSFSPVWGECLGQTPALGPGILHLFCCDTQKRRRAPGRRLGALPCCLLATWGLILLPPESMRASLLISVGVGSGPRCHIIF